VYGRVGGSAFALDGVTALGVDGDLAFGFLLDKFAAWVGATVLPGDCGRMVSVDEVHATTRSLHKEKRGLARRRKGAEGTDREF